MRALFLSQHFAPEITAATARLDSFVDAFLARGHEVDVVCAAPNHPEGRIRSGFRNRPVVRRDVAGARVRYVWVYARPHKSTRNRLLLYSSFATMSSAVAAAGPRPDIIIASSPPLTVGAAAMTVAHRFRRPWIFDVRDLWPGVAVALGELRHPRLVSAAERLEHALYRDASAIVTTTEPFKRHIAGLVDKEVEVLSNGTTKAWLSWGEMPGDRGALELPPEAFVWTYAGNLGLAQGLEHAIEAARVLGEGFHLCLIGDGPRRKNLEDMASDLPEGTVSFHGLMKAEQAAAYLRASDATFVSLDPDPRLSSFVPSKLFDCCAIGRPVVLAAQGEAVRLVEAEDAAVIVEPGNPQSIAGAMRELRMGRRDGGALAAASRDFALKNLREAKAKQLVELAERRGKH